MSACLLPGKRKLHQNAQDLTRSLSRFHEEGIYDNCPPHPLPCPVGLCKRSITTGGQCVCSFCPFHILNCHCVKCLVIKYGAARKLQLYLPLPLLLTFGFHSAYRESLEAVQRARVIHLSRACGARRLPPPRARAGPAARWSQDCVREPGVESGAPQPQCVSSCSVRTHSLQSRSRE